ncbi:hypothetical protein HHI36_017108, partial [Cryptolaemus montrouzieri]
AEDCSVRDSISNLQFGAYILPNYGTLSPLTEIAPKPNQGMTTNLSTLQNIKKFFMFHAIEILAQISPAKSETRYTLDVRLAHPVSICPYENQTFEGTAS